ncbi:hypothetical protein BTR14_15275 [Rhizobium rhizosphaerae]|uniref:Uncharacterized protein n=1 Tax=Xaviernesmea rhizosphaerae TaxID=1672749 RepID=A0ABX3PAQ8_9HYPH|nr:hypothetical protein [Xaviernesmea rhizosphaerae]OQP85546.1 hypothetical protein BTR14_15275 [Xaviernesmea rhizosphaerae]
MRGLSLVVPLSLVISLSALDLTLSASILLCLLLTDRARRSLYAALMLERAAGLSGAHGPDGRFAGFPVTASPPVAG